MCIRTNELPIIKHEKNYKNRIHCICRWLIIIGEIFKFLCKFIML